MGALSKLFLELPEHPMCSYLLHPNETCTQVFINSASIGCFNAAQFYLPTLVIPLLMKIKSLNREIVIQALINFGKCILLGNCFGIIFTSGVCLFRKIFGKFYFPWFLQVPAAFACLPFYYLPKRIKQWQITGIFNMYFEAMIRKSNNRIIETLRTSRIFGTLMFMSFSAIIITGFKLTGMKRFWFTTMPQPNNDKTQSSAIIKPCVHGGMCTDYIWKEFSKSSKLALILGLIKFLVSNFKRIKLAQPTVAVNRLVQRLDYNMMAFTIFYNTLFKLLYCLFNNKTGQNTAANAMTAAFISGIAYSLYPRYMIYTYGITTSLQMLWSIYSKYIVTRSKESMCNDSNRTDFIKISSRFIDFVNKWPIANVAFVWSFSYLFRCRFECPYATPIYVHNFISLGSSKRSDFMALRIAQILLGISSP